MTKSELILLLCREYGESKPSVIANEARKLIKNWSQEYVIVTGLTYRKHILGSKVICIGNEFCVQNDFFESFKFLLKIRATHFYHIHNHPYCVDLKPSSDDKYIKKTYEKQGEIMHIRLAGSMIINQLNEVLF